MQRHFTTNGLTGNFKTDANMANRWFNFESIPKGYTWHHVEDGRTLQLVPRDIHTAVKAHWRRSRHEMRSDMSVEFRRTGSPVTEPVIRDLESLVGHRLPDDFRVFVLEQNGGVPAREVHTPGPESVGVRAFFMLDDDPDYSMANALEVYTGRYPDGMLPIATDSSSNLILLDLGYVHPGSVWFWNHEEEANDDEPPRTDNITKVADTFEEFLTSLTDRLSDEEEALIQRGLDGATGGGNPDFVPEFD